MIFTKFGFFLKIVYKLKILVFNVIKLKKHKSMINNYSLILTYFMRFNTNIISLHFKIIIRVVVMYVIDYITKCLLMLAFIFNIIKIVFK